MNKLEQLLNDTKEISDSAERFNTAYLLFIVLIFTVAGILLI